ncbi:hypothetical protein CQ062_24170 [Ochrobactrum sp. MYb68]|nr:hypothetical protein CQ062_24170 [Ochrobactrum sp. MYb68]
MGYCDYVVITNSEFRANVSNLCQAEQLDTVAAVLPMNRRDVPAEVLSDQDVETFRHLQPKHSCQGYVPRHHRDR